MRHVALLIHKQQLPETPPMPTFPLPPTHKIHPDYPKSQQLEERHLAGKNHKAVKPPAVSILISTCVKSTVIATDKINDKLAIIKV